VADEQSGDGQAGRPGRDDQEALRGVDAREQGLVDGAGDVGVNGDVGERCADAHGGAGQHEQPEQRGLCHDGEPEAAQAPGHAAPAQQAGFADAAGQQVPGQVADPERAQDQAVAAEATVIAVRDQERDANGERGPCQVAGGAQHGGVPDRGVAPDHLPARHQ
jgi:hypothetical protein